MVAGQPPLHITCAYPSTSMGELPSISPSSNSDASETSQVLSPVSSSVIDDMLILAMRPVPVWCSFDGSTGVAEPVKRNCPGSPFDLSASLITASHSTGASCHSSMSRGLSPRNSNDGCASSASRLLVYTSGSLRRSALFACCSHVDVLPTHFGPRTKLQRRIDKSSHVFVSHIASLTQCDYTGDFRVWRYFTFGFGGVSLSCLAILYFRVWRRFIRIRGGI